ncbi:MAG: methylated-DNA--[protein]-cysteine S-methyltransferase [Promethearchaeota archaeon]
MDDVRSIFSYMKEGGNNTMKVHHSCIEIPGVNVARVCIEEDARTGALTRIKFIIRGYNDGDCAGCLEVCGIRPKVFHNIEVFTNLLAFFNGRMMSITGKLKKSVLGFLNTEFKRDVARALLATRSGDTITYGELARRAGHPGSARAVGSAMKVNPFPIIIPCHRVIPAGGGLGGFGGNKHPAFKDIKKALLKLEHARMAGDRDELSFLLN